MKKKPVSPKVPTKPIPQAFPKKNAPQAYFVSHKKRK